MPIQIFRQFILQDCLDYQQVSGVESTLVLFKVTIRTSTTIIIFNILYNMELHFNYSKRSETIQNEIYK